MEKKKHERAHAHSTQMYAESEAILDQTGHMLELCWSAWPKPPTVSKSRQLLLPRWCAKMSQVLPSGKLMIKMLFMGSPSSSASDALENCCVACEPNSLTCRRVEGKTQNTDLL